MIALFQFLVWEGALWAASLRLARASGLNLWLATVAIQITLEASIATLLTFAGWNHPAVYWVFAGVCALWGFRGLRCVIQPLRITVTAVAIAVLSLPLLALASRPVEEIDSINYLHYMIDWMANRATPYTFATNYVAFWEISFLPAWLLTRVDVFFPLLALKAVILLALALWQLGGEIGLRGQVLAWTVFGALTMRHYWFEYSGVPTLKNDALHGAGFVLLALAVVRKDAALLALGAAFASVKYTGVFLSAAAMLVVARGLRTWVAVLAFWLFTSGHYYLRSLIRHGSPFYPFQINFGPIHLPGTADLSYSSILYNLHDPRLWRAFFLPAGGISPAGVLFPAILAGTLMVAIWRCVRWKGTPLDWTGAAVLLGWVLYFRSVFSASAGPGDLAFLLNGLNSLRYVDGVLAASELFLAAHLGRFALPLVGVNAASRLFLLYSKISLPMLAAAGSLLFFPPPIVERNRASWTAYWNELKPALASAGSGGLAVLAVPDGGYYAGHVVAAGNPVDPSVRSVSVEDMDSLPAGRRPAFLAVLVTPGSEAAGDWKERYATRIQKWGYTPREQSRYGGIFEKLPAQALQ